ncbi:glycosyltransferase [Methylomonas sp. AM2-LC]|uniref:glycosyltransferase n=1 Tax=Methylomonas sp. AM2-LC TaxID=3153301 RepID=UPI003266D87B
MSNFVFDLKCLPAEHPDISVICINRNHEKYIEDTILSVLAQKFDNFEFLIADGGSTDSSLDIIRQYPFIQLVTGQDTCREEGLLRALNAARGRYVMVTTSTDGYLSRDWFKRAATILDQDSQVSLVFGGSAAMGSEGTLGAITYPVQFPFQEEQEKGRLSQLWLQYGLEASYLPELNYCVRMEVFKQLMGPSSEFPTLNDIDPILRFHFEFNRLGYISSYQPVLANFGRTHPNQAQISEKNNRYLRIYNENWRNYRKSVMLGKLEHVFRDGNGNPIAKNKQTTINRLQLFLPRIPYFQIRQFIKNII